ncbi:hypothetical protein [Dactylosporangium sp. NPDC049140]|uniref:hypothetical protein n=1 Tax=Dactylosporangium sp. NPDC049140 TaxID=3155647 RepID=UPI0033C7864A
MEFVAGPPSCWLVTLTSGACLELWADMFSQEAGMYEFVVMVRADPAEQSKVRVVSGPNGHPGTAVIAVARIPESEVAGVEGGWDFQEQRPAS